MFRNARTTNNLTTTENAIKEAARAAGDYLLFKYNFFTLKMQCYEIFDPSLFCSEYSIPGAHMKQFPNPFSFYEDYKVRNSRDIIIHTRR